MSVRQVGPAVQSIEPCRMCHQSVEKIKKCGKCLVAYYCSVECQGKDWPEHKMVCNTPQERAEKTSTFVLGTEHLMKSPKLLEALKLTDTPPNWSEIQKAENEIRRHIETSPDKEILLSFIDRVFSQDQCEKKLLKIWNKLTPEDRQFRLEKYQKMTSMIMKQNQLKSSLPKSNINPFLRIKKAAENILSLPEISYPDLAELKKAANTILEIMPSIEASPDVEVISDYCARSISGMVLERDLKLHWSQLPAQEAARRKQAWEKIAPRYEIFVKALAFLQMQAYKHFIPKP